MNDAMPCWAAILCSLWGSCHFHDWLLSVPHLIACCWQATLFVGSSLLKLERCLWDMQARQGQGLPEQQMEGPESAHAGRTTGEAAADPQAEASAPAQMASPATVAATPRANAG